MGFLFPFWNIKYKLKSLDQIGLHYIWLVKPKKIKELRYTNNKLYFSQKIKKDRKSWQKVRLLACNLEMRLRRKWHLLEMLKIELYSSNMFQTRIFGKCTFATLSSPLIRFLGQEVAVF